ncbi:LAQU0S05e00320g1_1 [Lachancea quebecensis]|uniref:histone acetyltransferase n=1 Tax=Lachancea quebecensis TaxID=1654605 RepID=A0A0P1KR79_9SACH|nr:LAQU0S05e00320g1_1 [Lachancea quebecensis]
MENAHLAWDAFDQPQRIRILSSHVMGALESILSRVLPANKNFELLHLQSPPKESHSIFVPQQSDYPQTVVKVQHFFGLGTNEKIFYSLELFVYLTVKCSRATEKLVFVSKADTNGYCDERISVKDVTTAILDYIVTLDPLHYLSKVVKVSGSSPEVGTFITRHTTTRRALRILKARHDSKNDYSTQNESRFRCIESKDPDWNCKICLFTRSEPQYLFSESSHNPKKHILSGEQLLLWWLSVIDKILVRHFDRSTKATLQIPGEEDSRTLRYLSSNKAPFWRVGDIFSGKSSDLAVFAIPVFPDDPKGRFLEQIVEENRAKTVRLSDFWTELQIQQEFRLGCTVSVIGVDGRITENCFEPRSNEVILMSSKRAFNKVKSYIVGEQYDTSEGAYEAYANLRDFLHLRMQRSLLKIKGCREKTGLDSKNVAATRDHSIRSLNTLTVRRKVKKPI